MKSAYQELRNLVAIVSKYRFLPFYVKSCDRFFEAAEAVGGHSMTSIQVS